ncbi:velvet factor-domain-containing protein [Umbelopsis sp. PMI_123]|nr:velvet factor-domain-containing protein [Umbelopsis sp. PMI_123]
MQDTPYSQPPDYSCLRLIVRQQPIHARLCSFKEKVDRRPIDPPPIVQLVCDNPGIDQQHFLQNPFFFLVCSLQNANDYDTQGNRVDCNQSTAGTVVQSLHKLKDLDGTDGGFFLFSDISVRVEGYFRLRFTLFEIVGTRVVRRTSTLSDVFQVYSPKLFPGMAESTLLTRHLSDQGMRIRIRKENRILLRYEYHATVDWLQKIMKLKLYTVSENDLKMSVQQTIPAILNLQVLSHQTPIPPHRA